MFILQKFFHWVLGLLKHFLSHCCVTIFKKTVPFFKDPIKVSLLLIDTPNWQVLFSLGCSDKKICPKKLRLMQFLPGSVSIKALRAKHPGLLKQKLNFYHRQFFERKWYKRSSGISLELLFRPENRECGIFRTILGNCHLRFAGSPEQDEEHPIAVWTVVIVISMLSG